ncbi:MAG: tRNA guanosine(34) transglycosylase Tgt [Armatimonadetes bacterium]|nr:tRNA guanosine(34) transglycosylase Tgt [Armatimonadota bacterium]
MSAHFQILHTCSRSRARRGRLLLARGAVDTPAFMPVGTQATVRCMTPEDLKEIGVQMVLANTFHLYLRPGTDLIRRSGGLHAFMHWDGPILTDSGGYQVFSLSHLRRVADDGVLFRSPFDGSEHFLTPELVLEIQGALGSDVILPLDVCSGYPCPLAEAREALRRTMVWAHQSRESHRADGQMLFGIVQGGFESGLRAEAARQTAALDFPGLSIGGLSVGEPVELTCELLEAVVPHLPTGRPRHLLGVGVPPTIVQAVRRGIDLFDCALPTRVARTGVVFTRQGRLNLRNAAFRDDLRPVDETCGCQVCRHYTRAYLRHLFKADEMLGPRLATFHNLHFLTRLMEEIRQQISAGTFAQWSEAFLAQYTTTW